MAQLQEALAPMDSSRTGVVVAQPLLFVTTFAHAATFLVTNTNNDGPGSLRQAVIDANGSPGTDVVNFGAVLSNQTITPDSSISVTDSLTLSGKSSEYRTGEPTGNGW